MTTEVPRHMMRAQAVASSKATGGRPALVAITLSEHGGGIAVVSRLLAAMLAEQTGGPCLTLTLAGNGRGGSFATGTARRLVFGGEVAAAQVLRRCDWLLFSHLALADVQSYVPPPVRRPYGVFLHDVEAWTPLTGRRLGVLSRAFVRLANSHYTARRVEEANPQAGPVTPCPLGLPDPEIDPGAGEATADPFGIGEHAIVIVGRMLASERYKGHDQLIEAWPDVRRAVAGARLVCVGEGDDVARLRAKAQACGVGESVVFTGFVTAAERRVLYERAAALAMPSRREGFGLVYLEAMAARRPCIGSSVDAAREVIVDGVTGFLVSPDDRGALAGRIVDLLVDVELRRRLGKAGRQRFEAEFTYEAFVSRVSAAITAATMPTERRDLASRRVV